MTVDELKVQMQNNYYLGGIVVERLHFSYETHTSGGNEMLFCLDNMVTSVRILNSKMLMEMRNWWDWFIQGVRSDDSWRQYQGGLLV